MTAAPHPTSPLDVPGLLSLLQRQRDLLRQLAELAGQQGKLVEEGAADQLLGLLGQRQRILGDLEQAHAQLQAYRENWAAWTARFGPVERPKVSNLLSEIEALRQGILAQDERDCQTLAAARGRLAAELDRTAHAGRAINAYRVAPSAAARFTDRQG